MPTKFSNPAEIMQRAIQLARQGVGSVEPNPMVGAVIVDDELQSLAEGYHQKHGGPHAEINAINSARCNAHPETSFHTTLKNSTLKKTTLKNSTLYVTLEPCAHRGKTGPCAEAVIAAGIRKVVIGCKDPAPHTKGNGIKHLEEAGIEVEVGFLQAECEKLIRPFTKLMITGLPYVHAKWAMTLDGRIASRTGSSQWITNEDSRKIVHQIRGRMDAILVGAGTVRADNPLLTTRPPGERIATRIVLDSNASTPLDSKLVQSVSEAPLIIACLEESSEKRCLKLEQAGVELIRCPANKQSQPCIEFLLKELGSRKMTNLLVEGGSKVLGSFFDLKQIDEVHTFIAPKIIAGANSPGPVAGTGISEMNHALQFQEEKTVTINGDIYFNGHTNHHCNQEEHQEKL